ncbi:hypothetical protein M405DRAFT_930132 [Rhizopogon salebrosus TDB-379]|nr:hypothetical protein M405DRAFT_930132 [Rhizopogon salebrosus TDB-379]
MSDLPNPQSYYIFANIPSADRRPVGATVLEGEEWTLTYDDRENGICMFYGTQAGGSLGLKKSVYNDNTVFHVTDPGVEVQRWRLNKVDDDSYTIQLVTPVFLVFFWHVDHAGERVKAVPATDQEIQTWRFEAVDGPYSMPEECTMTVFTHPAVVHEQILYKLLERPTVNFYDLDARLFESKVTADKHCHDTMNNLLSVESLNGLGDEEIEGDELFAWLDDLQEGTSEAPEDAGFEVELEIDLSADGFYAVGVGVGNQVAHSFERPYSFLLFQISSTFPDSYHLCSRRTLIVS